MLATISGFIAVFCYTLGTYFLSRELSSDSRQRTKVLVFGFSGAGAHLINVVAVIHSAAGVNFSFFKIATLFSWSIVTLVLISSLKKPLQILFLALFPLAVLSILCSLYLPGDSASHEAYPSGVIMHIILAILATSFISIAAFQAGFLAYQNYQLKHKHPRGLVRHLPPLQTMEALLFELVWVGILLLSGVILTGILFMEDFFGQHLSHKAVLSVIAWLVFAVLLWGRHQLGWRGKTATRWTLLGFVFLFLSYFGSKFVLELILNRV